MEGQNNEETTMRIKKQNKAVRITKGKRHLMKTKILRNIFVSLSAVFALTRLVAAGTHYRSLDLSDTPLGGGIITFDAPGAGTGPQQGTLTYVINDRGTIAGYYFDSKTVTHGFVHATDGTFTTFDAPGGGTGAYQGTLA